MELQSYAVVFHESKLQHKDHGDTLHWAAFNIPACEGMPAGLERAIFRTVRAMARASTLAAATTRTSVPARAPPVPHYVFEFYAGYELDLPASVSRDDLMKAMERPRDR